MIKARIQLYYILLFSLVLIIPISSYSLWMDEALTAWWACQNSLNTLVSTLLTIKVSEAQMPGYIFYVWVWEKIFGFSEFALRLASLPFAILFLFVLWKAKLSMLFKKTYSVLFCLSPFIWYNLNEARVNIILFSLSGYVLFGLIYFFSSENNRNKKLVVYLAAFSFLSGLFFNLLFIFSLVPLSIILIYFIKIKNKKILLFKNIWKEWKFFVLVFLILFTLLMVYYIFTLLNGAGGIREYPSFFNIGVVMYEFLGFSGLGPPRNLMRSEMTFRIVTKYLIYVVPLFALYSFLIFYSFGSKFRKELTIQSFPFLLSVVVSLLIFFLAAYIFRFNFWGRHVIYILPYFFYFQSQVVSKYFEFTENKIFSILFMILILFLTLSCLNLRYNKNYAKDNDKLAATMAINLTTAKDTILWDGPATSAAYYGIKINGFDIPSKWKIKRQAKSVGEWTKNYFDLFIKSNSILILVSYKKYNNLEKELFLKTYKDYLYCNTDDFKLYKFVKSSTTK